MGVLRTVAVFSEIAFFNAYPGRALVGRGGYVLFDLAKEGAGGFDDVKGEAEDSGETTNKHCEECLHHRQVFRGVLHNDVSLFFGLYPVGSGCLQNAGNRVRLF